MSRFGYALGKRRVIMPAAIGAGALWLGWPTIVVLVAFGIALARLLRILDDPAVDAAVERQRGRRSMHRRLRRGHRRHSVGRCLRRSEEVALAKVERYCDDLRQAGADDLADETSARAWAIVRQNASAAPALETFLGGLPPLHLERAQEPNLSERIREEMHLIHAARREAGLS